VVLRGDDGEGARVVRPGSDAMPAGAVSRRLHRGARYRCAIKSSTCLRHAL
jgi:hypothetical protein